MEAFAPTRPKSKKLKATSEAPLSSAPSSSVPSPELLSLIERLQEDIAELRSTKGMTADEKQELVQLKKDLAEAKAELAASKPPRHTPAPAPELPRRVNYGLFSVEHVG